MSYQTSDGFVFPTASATLRQLIDQRTTRSLSCLHTGLDHGVKLVQAFLRNKLPAWKPSWNLVSSPRLFTSAPLLLSIPYILFHHDWLVLLSAPGYNALSRGQLKISSLSLDLVTLTTVVGPPQSYIISAHHDKALPKLVVGADRPELI